MIMDNKRQNAKINSPPFRDKLNGEVFRWTNVERRKNGLEPFQPHPKLHLMATIHSEQMLCHGFFSHENPYEPEFRTLSDRLQHVTDNGFIGFHAYAENIAMCPTLNAMVPIKAGEVQFEVILKGGVPHYYDMSGNEMFRYTVEEYARAVVTGWMNSPGHRRNILDPAYEYLGCGCAGYQQKLGNGALVNYYYLTQNFGGGEITAL